MKSGSSHEQETFTTSVRAWETDVVASALAEAPALAKYVDQSGKATLHHCAGINAKDAKLSLRKSILDCTRPHRRRCGCKCGAIIIDDGEEIQATPLWDAVAWGKNFDLARFLLENGADPDNNSVRSAIWDQDLNMAQLLFSFGASIDPVSNETPLLQTVRSRRLRLLKWLVDHGANINFQDHKGYSPLHYGVKKGYNRAQIEELLRCGASPSMKAKDGESPISLARKLGKVLLVHLLEKRRPLNG